MIQYVPDFVSYVQQHIVMAENSGKLSRVVDFLKYTSSKEAVLIYCANKLRANNLFTKLNLEDIKAETILEDTPFKEHKLSTERIRSGRARVLITDMALFSDKVAAHIKHVINYDFPCSMAAYVDRINAKALTGSVVTFFTTQDMQFADVLISKLQKIRNDIPDELIFLAKLHQRTCSDTKTAHGYCMENECYPRDCLSTG